MKKDFYQLFGLEPDEFQLDEAQLGARYRALQKKFHPDRVVGAPTSEQRLAAQLSAHINEGFQTLRDPVRRAGYLLERRGVDLRVLEREPMDGAFLMQQIELRETLADVATEAEIAAARAEAEAIFDLAVSAFDNAWSKQDESAAGACWVKLLYLSRLREEARSKSSKEV